MSAPELARLTWKDAGAALARARIALVPVGSTEQHGPHMTLDSDSAIAEGFARRLGEELGDAAIVCPTVPVGMSEHHMAFAGTLTLRAATLIAVVRDIAESLASHRVTRVLLVNGHGGNLDALRLAAREAARDGPVRIATVMWALLAADLIAERAATDRHAHACDIETSVALALAPHVVLCERIAGPGPVPDRRPVAEPRDPVDVPVPFERWTSDGALGDPSLATRELGEEIVALAIERAKKFALTFLAEPADR